MQVRRDVFSALDMPRHAENFHGENVIQDGHGLHAGFLVGLFQRHGE